ncbi:unnamed protein product, partial [Mesorhabditis spiculigera]
MEGKFRPRVHVFGPFEQILRYLGVDLTDSIFSWEESRKRGRRCRAALSTIVFLFILFVFFAKFVMIMSIDAKAFTMGWAESNIDAGIFLFGIASTVCLAIWTHCQYPREFQEKLDALEEGPVRSEESFAKTHVKAFIFSLILLTVYILPAGEGHIFQRDVNSTLPTYQYDSSNFWGAEPLIRALIGFVSCVSIAIYVISTHAMGRKLKAFNNDLKEASEAGKLNDQDTLSNYSSRQHEILELVRYSHGHIGKLATFGLVGAAIIQANGMFFIIGHRADITGAFFGLISGFMIVSGGILGLSIMVPAKLQQKISEVESILLFDRVLWADTKSESCQSMALAMVRRAQSDSLKITIMHAYLLDQRLPHKLLMIIPLMGNIFVGLERLFPPKNDS